MTYNARRLFCSVVGCSREIIARDLCSKHYEQARSSGQLELHKRHGQSYTPTYQCWASMKDRCDNKNNVRFSDYGGRGITYDPAWKDFEKFLADMGRKPAGKSLDRKDNEGNYDKGNCQWATPLEQAATRRKRAGERDSGVVGVYLTTKGRWTARAYRAGQRLELYHGADFFEAVCARKSWEANNAR